MKHLTSQDLIEIYRRRKQEYKKRKKIFMIKNEKIVKPKTLNEEEKLIYRGYDRINYIKGLRLMLRQRISLLSNKLSKIRTHPLFIGLISALLGALISYLLK